MEKIGLSDRERGSGNTLTSLDATNGTPWNTGRVVFQPAWSLSDEGRPGCVAKWEGASESGIIRTMRPLAVRRRWARQES
jgi:hypothetical protein